jgi:ribosome-binding protein aMBF1 (putative translation factor)
MTRRSDIKGSWSSESRSAETTAKQVKRALMAAQVAKTLRIVRQQRGISQERLGAMADVTRTYVGRIERRILNPTMSSMGSLLRALGVTWAEFGAVLDAADGD